MTTVLQDSAVFRFIVAILRWFSALFGSSCFIGALKRAWAGSSFRYSVRRLLLRDSNAIAASGSQHLFQKLNDRLSACTLLREAWSESLFCRLVRAILRWFRESFIFGAVFEGGICSVLLFFTGLYALIDYALRDVLSIPVISSVWDEGLLVLCILAVIWQRIGTGRSVPCRMNPLDFPVSLYITVAFCLLCFLSPYPYVQLTGFRASCQYLLWFFVITRLIRNDHDFKVLYLTMVILAAAIALHGIYQYIAAVPIPASWMTHSETSVRTRVFSIFGSPNIMGDYLVMFAPMSVAVAYFEKNRKLQVLAWTAGILMCISCLFTMSRASWVAMAVAIVLFCLLVDRRLFALLAAACICMLFLPFVRSRIGFLFTDAFAEANTSGGRAGRKLNAMMLFETCNPWFGLGHGMFGGAVAMQTKIMDHVDYFYVDNYYLKTMLETGYTGLISFILMMTGFLLSSMRALCRKAKEFKEKKNRLYPLLCGMFSGLCGVLVHCGFENIFEEPYMMVYFWTVAAMIVWAGFLRAPQED